MKNRISALFALFFCLWLAVCPVFAASTTEAVEPIVTGNGCTLTVCCRAGVEKLSGLSLSLYKIASVSADYQYTYTSDFSACPLPLNDITAQAEWDALRTTLESMVCAESCRPAATAKTDADGIAVFDGLTPGLYFLPGLTLRQDGSRLTVSSTLVAVPGLDARTGRWEYEVTVYPKYSRSAIPPNLGKTQYQVVKLWKGDGVRPGSVTVALYCDGTLAETVLLSEENNWRYSWSDLEGSQWQVLEQDVPTGYAMSVDVRGSTFYLTNTATPTTPAATPRPSSQSPYTGDTMPLGLWITLLCISGLVLVVLGLTRRRDTP